VKASYVQRPGEKKNQYLLQLAAFPIKIFGLKFK
jgi:hypothetical protein